MAASDSGDIREGFLCPICMKDLQTVQQLQNHFEEAHNTEADKQVFQHLKGLFGRAKSKLLRHGRDQDGVRADRGTAVGRSDSSDQVAAISTAYYVGGVDPTMWEPQDFGTSRSHMDNFKKIRDARIDFYVIEMNKLLIRLEKMLAFDRMNPDPVKKKEFEIGLVPWAPDDAVPYCPTCGEKFNLSRRRHHCRLCGGIMCNRCSEFLTPIFTAKLVNKAGNPPVQHIRGEEKGHRRQGSAGTRAMESLRSLVGEVVGEEPREDGIRTCQDCMAVMRRRERQIQEKTTKPVIVQLYEKLRMLMDKVEAMCPEYTKMAESLNAGETSYNLEHANNIRSQLMRCYEAIDTIGKKIATMGASGAEQQLSPQAIRLQQGIRKHCTLFIQDNVFGLPSLPSEDQLRKLQEQRRLEIEQRLALERQAALEAEERRRNEEQRKRSPEKDRKGGATASTVDTANRDRTESIGKGWTPTVDSSSVATTETDPMLQQMDIIRSFVEQARAAGRLDEVEMLEANLRELQQEYWRQHRRQAYQE
ncbi:PREDICTED: rabenosyn-5-like [Branchiostoma belcheri]|uniref:Rabenosyn-5-like n=1 Tax=Branchiostoma belcheri TaxID=7741 RepID=A0A6P4ZUP9_BRABE|nr:PREDICTED: rabenosyn-5-like [Branchiostoma belcheri]